MYYRLKSSNWHCDHEYNINSCTYRLLICTFYKAIKYIKKYNNTEVLWSIFYNHEIADFTNSKNLSKMIHKFQNNPQNHSWFRKCYLGKNNHDNTEYQHIWNKIKILPTAKFTGLNIFSNWKWNIILNSKI